MGFRILASLSGLGWTFWPALKPPRRRDMSTDATGFKNITEALENPCFPDKDLLKAQRSNKKRDEV
jgi:hypothetical protein